MITEMDLPPRSGTRPRTTSSIPHTQLDQQPADPRELDSILDEAATWPHVVGWPSRIAVEGSRALVLAADAAGGPGEAFMVDLEFCHGHAGGDQSLHATLPPPLASWPGARGGPSRTTWCAPAGRRPRWSCSMHPGTGSSATSSSDSCGPPTSSP